MTSLKIVSALMVNAGGTLGANTAHAEGTFSSKS